jgi:hypothetical protein
VGRVRLLGAAAANDGCTIGTVSSCPPTRVLGHAGHKLLWIGAKQLLLSLLRRGKSNLMFIKFECELLLVFCFGIFLLSVQVCFDEGNLTASLRFWAYSVHVCISIHLSHLTLLAFDFFLFMSDHVFFLA